MSYRPLWLPVALVLASFAVGCGSADSPAESASPTPAETTAASPTQTATTTEPTTAAPTTAAQATAAPGAATVAPTPTTGAIDQPNPLVEELDPMESVQGGNVNQVYPGAQYPPELAGIIASMIDDVAERSGAAVDDIKIVAVADVTWSDASLGCGQPGFAYAQVVTDGMRVVLQVGDLFYDYRSGGVDAFFLCSQSASLASGDASLADAAPAADDGDKSSPGLYEITEDGVVQIEPPTYDDQTPTEGTNPPDE